MKAFTSSIRQAFARRQVVVQRKTRVVKVSADASGDQSAVSDPTPTRWNRYAARFQPPPARLGVLEAHQQGTLGFGFSAGGLLFPYYVGVVSALHELKVLRPDVPLAGASAGSLIVGCYKSGMSAETVLAACLDLARDCRKNGTRFRLQSVLERVMRDVLPADAHVRCSGSTHIAVTKVYPEFKPLLISEFDSRDHLIATLMTSCHIPWYFNGRLTTPYAGELYFDGGLTQFIPAPPDVDHTVQVCCFPAKQLRAFPGIQISPDRFEEWPHDIRQMLSWALEPAEEDLLLYFVEKGSKDATAWAVANGLVAAEEKSRAASPVAS